MSAPIRKNTPTLRVPVTGVRGYGEVVFGICEWGSHLIVIEARNVAHLPDGWVALDRSTLRELVDFFDPPDVEGPQTDEHPEADDGSLTLDRRQVETVQALVRHAQEFMPFTPDFRDLYRTVFDLPLHNNTNEEAPHG